MCETSSVVYTINDQCLKSTFCPTYGELKVPIFYVGDKHCVITPKKWFAIFSINFSIPESISSHSTDFIIDIIISTKILKLTSFLTPFKIGENPYCCTKLYVQNELYHHHNRSKYSEIPCTCSQ